MNTVLLAVVIGILCIISFTVGAHVGQKVVNNEPIKLPTLNPVKVVNEIKETKEQQKELEKLKIIAENIDKYDGTGLGQKDIPK